MEKTEPSTTEQSRRQKSDAHESTSSVIEKSSSLKQGSLGSDRADLTAEMNANSNGDFWKWATVAGAYVHTIQ